MPFPNSDGSCGHGKATAELAGPSTPWGAGCASLTFTVGSAPPLMRLPGVRAKTSRHISLKRSKQCSSVVLAGEWWKGISVSFVDNSCGLGAHPEPWCWLLGDPSCHQPQCGHFWLQRSTPAFRTGCWGPGSHSFLLGQAVGNGPGPLSGAAFFPWGSTNSTSEGRHGLGTGHWGPGWRDSKSRLWWCSAGRPGHDGESYGATCPCAGSGLTSILPKPQGISGMCWPPPGGCELSPNIFAGHEQSCGRYGWACCPPYKYDIT